ncbi:PDK, partial [Symbiodinium sp. CCMP2456]
PRGSLECLAVPAPDLEIYDLADEASRCSAAVWHLVDSGMKAIAGGAHRLRSGFQWQRGMRFRSLGTQVVNVASSEDIAAFAAMRPHPRSVEYLTTTVDPRQIAEFLHLEMPIRYAERIRALEQVPRWQAIPDLVDVHDIHVKSFKSFRVSELDDFAEVTHQALLREQTVVEKLAKSVHHLRDDAGDGITDDSVCRNLHHRFARTEFGCIGSLDNETALRSQFLDDFLLNRIGCQVLLGHYLACRAGQRNGIIDTRCDTRRVCRAAAEAVLDMCWECTGRRPSVFVNAHSACGGKGTDDGQVPRFPYMPHVLKYIVSELLKNSCRATTDMLSAHDLQADDFPINVVICADEDHVTICVADQAGGIPREANPWSYLYTTAEDGAYGGTKKLAGHGVGLPLSRLYARYLHGSLDLVSLPGYGTHAYVNLPRVESQQVEVVPDADYEYDYANLLDFTV